MSDRGEPYGRDGSQRRLNSFKLSAMNNMGNQNRGDQQPYSNSSFMNDISFSQSSMRRVNSIAYGSDGLAFGVIPKEILDKIEDKRNDWHVRSSSFELIYNIIGETTSLKTLAPYSPSFLKYI